MNLNLRMKCEVLNTGTNLNLLVAQWRIWPIELRSPTSFLTDIFINGVIKNLLYWGIEPRPCDHGPATLPLDHLRQFLKIHVCYPPYLSHEMCGFRLYG